jgi:hypothetical protein
VVAGPGGELGLVRLDVAPGDVDHAGYRRVGCGQGRGELPQGGVEQRHRGRPQAERALVQVASHGGDQDRRSEGELVPGDLLGGAAGPAAADVGGRCLAAVEHHRVQPEQGRGQRLGSKAAHRDNGVVQHGPGVVVGRGGELRGAGAGDHADLGQVGPHPLDLLEAEPQAGGLLVEPGGLVEVGVAHVPAPPVSGGDHEDRVDRKIASHDRVRGEGHHFGAQPAPRRDR